MIKTVVMVQVTTPEKSNQYANKLMIAMRYRQIEVNALLMPVTPAFFLLFTNTDIENMRININMTDKIVGVNISLPPFVMYQDNRKEIYLFNNHDVAKLHPKFIFAQAYAK